MGELTILHGSPTEYLILFGSPIGTEGFSGRNDMEIWNFMIDGEMWTYEEGDYTRTTHRAGDTAYLRRGAGRGYRFPDRAFELEYARGNILSSISFGMIASTISYTLDFPGALGTIQDFIKVLLRPGT